MAGDLEELRLAYVIPALELAGHAQPQLFARIIRADFLAQVGGEEGLQPGRLLPAGQVREEGTCQVARAGVKKRLPVCGRKGMRPRWFREQPLQELQAVL